MFKAITDQPRKEDDDKKIEEATKELERKQLRGLSSLSIANAIVIEVEKKCCSSDSEYVIKSYNGDNIMLTAEEESHCCYMGNLQNVIIRDLQKVPVGRVCYREKSCLSGDMNMQVFSPPDVLIGSCKELSSCFMSSSTFRIWDSNDKKLFCIQYNQGLGPQLCGCYANFTVTYDGTKQEVAKILEKTRQRLRLQFKAKLNVTNKMILTGFCLCLIHKAYKQKETGKDASDDE